MTNSGEHTFHFFDEELILLPEKAMYVTKYNALLVADLHLGKLTHFRKSGIGLPDHGEAANLEKLSEVLQRYRPDTCYFMGDLFHSDYNSMWEYLIDFLQLFPKVKFVLIEGNHDVLSSRQYGKAGLISFPKVELGPFDLTHEPEEPTLGRYNLCGHIHPGVRLKGKGLQRLRLPCYYFGKTIGILPAFGSFTGLATLQPKKTDSVFVITQAEVIPV